MASCVATVRQGYASFVVFTAAFMNSSGNAANVDSGSPTVTIGEVNPATGAITSKLTATNMSSILSETGWYGLAVDVSAYSTDRQYVVLIKGLIDTYTVIADLSFFVSTELKYIKDTGETLMGATDVVSANMTQILGTAVLTPGTAGTLDVNAKLIGGTTQTGRDLGASVLLSSGTGTGQISLSSGLVTLAGVTHTGAVIPTVTNTGTVTGNVNGNVAGNVTGSVGSVASGGITAASIAADAITAAKIADGAIDAATFAAGAIDAAAVADGAIDAATFAAGAITAAAIATGAVDADALATDAVNEIAAATTDQVWDEVLAGSHDAVGSAGKLLQTAGAGAGPTAADIADAVWDEARAGHVAAGSFGQGVASVQGNVTGSVASVTAPVTAGTVSDKTGYSILAGDKDTLVDLIFDEVLSGHITDGTFGQRLQIAHAGTAQGGTSSSITLASSASSTVDDIYNDQYVYAVSGPGAGETHKILDYVSATRVATTTTWLTTPTSSTHYIILQGAADGTAIDVNVTKWLGTAVNADTAGYPKVTIKAGTGTGEVSLTSGQVTVGTIAAGAITAAAVATGAIDADAIADGAIDAGAIATGAITSAKFAAGAIDAAAVADGAIDAGAIAAGAITSAKFAAGAIDAAAIATNAIDADAIADGAINAAVFAGGAINAAALATDAVVEIAGGVWDEARSGHVVAGSFGQGVASVQGNVTGSVASVTGAVGSVAAGGITASSIATGAIDADALAADAVQEIVDANWDEILPGAHDTANSAGKILQDASAGSAPSAATIADAVWDELLSGHTILGSTGDAVGTELARQDALIAVKAKTDNLPADPVGLTNLAAAHGVGSYAEPTLAQIEASTILARQDAVVAIKAKTDNLPSDPVGLTNLAAAHGTGTYDAPTLADIEASTVLARQDALIAVKAKTDNLPADPVGLTNLAAAHGMGVYDSLATDIDAAEIADAVWDEVLPGAHDTANSAGDLLQSAGAGGDPAAIADAVWDEVATEHDTDGSMGAIMNDLAEHADDVTVTAS